MKIDETAILKVITLLKQDKIAKEGMENALIQISKDEKVELKNENIECIQQTREYASKGKSINCPSSKPNSN